MFRCTKVWFLCGASLHIGDGWYFLKMNFGSFSSTSLKSRAQATRVLHGDLGLWRALSKPLTGQESIGPGYMPIWNMHLTSDYKPHTGHLRSGIPTQKAQNISRGLVEPHTREYSSENRQCNPGARPPGLSCDEKLAVCGLRIGQTDGVWTCGCRHVTALNLHRRWGEKG